MINRLTVLYDGAVGPIISGGSGAYGFVVLRDEEQLAAESGFISPIPNLNQTTAEYHALVMALGWLDHAGLHDQHIRFHGRTMMIVNHMTGRWEAKGDYKGFHALAVKFTKRFKDVGFDCVVREKTELPRSLAEKELTKRGIEIFIPGNWKPETAQD